MLNAPSYDGTTPQHSNLPTVQSAWKTLYAAGHRPAYMGDDDERRDTTGFYIAGVDQHHITVAAVGTENTAEALAAYAKALQDSGDWRDVKVTTRAVRANEVRATLAEAPVIEHLDTREKLRDFAKAHRFADLHEMDVKARVIGQFLDNSSTVWDAQAGEASALCFFVVYVVDGVDAAYVSLAMLNMWAVED